MINFQLSFFKFTFERGKVSKKNINAKESAMVFLVYSAFFATFANEFSF